MSDVNADAIEMIKKLKANLLDEFSRELIDSAALALSMHSGLLRLNFFCLAVRILFEHTMAELAPEPSVLGASWFSAERADGKPSRRQRVAFAIQGGLSDSFVLEELKVDVAPLHKRLLNAVDQLSKHVHGREETIVSATKDQDEVAKSLLVEFLNFFEAFHDCRAAIVDPIAERLDDEAVNTLASDNLQDVAELASHMGLEEVYVSDVSVERIDAESIIYRASGSVTVTLQWGSNSDVRKGDGAELEQSFPFYCDFEVSVDDPWDLSDAMVTCGVDTQEWWDTRAPDE